MSPEEVGRFVDMMRTKGIQILKIEGLELVLGAIPSTGPAPSPKPPNPENMLFAATEGFEDEATS